MSEQKAKWGQHKGKDCDIFGCKFCQVAPGSKQRVCMSDGSEPGACEDSERQDG